MRTIDVGVRELIRVSKAQIHMRLCGEMKDGVDIVPLQTPRNVLRGSNVALLEEEICPAIKAPRIVQRRAIVEFVKGHNLVVIRVSQREVPYQPAGAMDSSIVIKPTSSCFFERTHAHESGPARDHDILGVIQWFEFRSAF